MQDDQKKDMRDGTLRIAVCDDDSSFQEQFAGVVREWDPAQRLECFSSGAELLKAAAVPPAFDMVFLDIYFPGENGLDVAAKLRKCSPETGIVFLTVSADHAVDAYSMSVLHYLVKPVTAEDVAEAYRRLKQIRSRPRPSVLLSVDHENIPVYLDEISHIVSSGHTKEIFLTDGTILRVWMQLEELSGMLGASFLKLNKGTIVNMEHIRTMSRDYCLLHDGTKLTFTRRGRHDVRAMYDEYMYSRLLGKEDGDNGMHIAVCDDSRLSQVLFLNALREWDSGQYAECFTSGAELLKAMRERPAFDIVFLDIYLPGENGMDIAAGIRSVSPRTGIVFLTNSQDHAVDAWSMNVLHYLVKPITAEGIRESFQRLKNAFPEPRPLIILNTGQQSHTVYLDEILCICSSRHAKEFHLTGGPVIRIWEKILDLEEKLDARFLKLNRGTIINMEHVRRMSREYCLLDDGTRFDFPRQKRETVREAYETWLFSHISAAKQV